MISADLQKAMESLQIHDVYLRDFVAKCAEGFEPKYGAFESLCLQTRYFVKRSNVVAVDDSQRLLRVFIDVGARWVAAQAADGDESVQVVIEAEFVAEYVMTESLDQASINEFSLQNVSYHVWPYWRELLNSQCTRMHLPRVVLATVQLAQNRGSQGDLPTGART